MNRDFPGPRDWIFGLSLTARYRRQPLQFLRQLARDFGDIAFFRLGPYRAVFVNHPDLIREVLVSKQEEFPKLERQAKVIRGLDGNSLFVQQGPPWLRQRRLVQAAFHPNRLQHYAEIMVAHTQQRMEKWSPESPIDFSDEAVELALSIISKILFDLDLDRQTALLRKVVYARSELFVREMTAVVDLPDWLPLPAKRRKQWGIRTTDDLIPSSS